MNDEARITTLEQLLERLCQTTNDRDEVNVGQMLAAAGRRSFGPLLLLPGIIVFSPLSGVPGLPTTMAVLVMLVAGQLVLGKRQFWLPQWILCRHASRDKVRKAVKFVSPVARVVDKITRQRLKMLTEGSAVYVVGALCILVALTMPVMELVPFANSAAGAVLTVFGVGLVSQDGLLTLLAIALCVAGAVFAAIKLLG